jgi:hypothetical protein
MVWLLHIFFLWMLHIFFPWSQIEIQVHLLHLAATLSLQNHHQSSNKQRKHKEYWLLTIDRINH